MERSKSLVKATKVVPKGAQSKFFARKSFLRECRAKYRRNIRRSAKSQHENTAEIYGEPRKVNAKIPPKYKAKREKSMRKYR
jgi:hypothetical protein